MIGNPAFYFEALGCAGRANCTLNFKQGSDVEFDICNTLMDYEIEYSTSMSGTTLKADVDINQKVCIVYCVLCFKSPLSDTRGQVDSD